MSAGKLVSVDRQEESGNGFVVQVVKYIYSEFELVVPRKLPPQALAEHKLAGLHTLVGLHKLDYDLEAY